MRKLKKTISVLLSILLIWHSLGAIPSLKANAAETGELSLSLGATTSSGGTYYYNNATVTGSGVKTILLSFSKNVESSDKIILPTSPSGFTVSDTSASNNYTKRININTDITGTDNAAAVQTYLRGIGFQLTSSTQSVKVTVTTESIPYDTFYDVETQHYYQYVPDTSSSWTVAYKNAQAMKYMGRTGYLATITSKSEDTFVNQLSGGKVGWLGGTILKSSGNKVDASGTANSTGIYYSSIDTTGIVGTGWYWACGPEIGTTFYSQDSLETSSTNATAATATAVDAQNTTQYYNWARGTNSYEPNNKAFNSTSDSKSSYETCLTTLQVDGNTGKQGTAFSWNDKHYDTAGTDTWSAKGYFVEYGNMTTGDSTTSATGYASITGSLSSSSYAASISGSPIYGQTLTANLTGGSATAYQWTRDDGSISGATGRTYTLTASDVGHQIAVKIAVDGTTVTSPTVETTALPVAGSGGALSFDGADDYVDLGASNSNLVLGNTFTEEAWVYPEQITGYVGIVGNEVTNGDALTRAPSIYLCGGGSSIHVGFGDGTNWNNITTGSILTLNSWSHIAFVYNGSTMFIYVNGILKASQNCTATPCSTSIRNIGRINNYSTDGYFKGQLDEVKIWNKAHTQDEIRSDMYSHPASGTSGLVGYWSLDKGSGSTVTDFSGNGNDGTLTNMDTSSCWTNSGAWQNRMTAENIALTMDAGYSQDGGSISLAQSSAPSNGGSLAFNNSSKTVTYTPKSNFYGTDTFTYTVTEYGISKSYTVNMTVVQKPTITATTDNANNCVNLNWTPTNASDHYMVYQKVSSETVFQSIPVSKNIKVLNVYPDDSGSPKTGTFDGAATSSDSLKTWMGTTVPEKTYTMGSPLVNGTQYSMTVSNVPLSVFNSNPIASLGSGAGGNYNCDAIFFGSWDCNGDQGSAGDLSSDAKSAVETFIKYGGGYLTGHDTASFNHPNFINLAQTYLNMQVNYNDFSPDAIGDTNVKISKKGLLMDFPYSLGNVGDVLTVPKSHSYYEFAMGNVWFKYNSSNWGDSNKDYANGTEVSTFNNQSGTNNFYLTTWNNTAMIQTGHSNGAATTDEQKILTNTLYYLAQVTKNTSAVDHMAQDMAAPNQVNSVHASVDANSNAVVSFDPASDNGSTYDYYVREFTADDGSSHVDSDKKTATVTTGVKGYAISVDQNSTADPGTTVNATTPTFHAGTLTPSGSYYAHIRTVDNAGNVSEVSNIAFTMPAAASISGSPVVGHTLTANLAGESTSDALTYQWMRGDQAISGATGKTYTLTDVDVGKPIAVEITVSDTTVTSPAVTVTALALDTALSAMPDITEDISADSNNGQFVSALLSGHTSGADGDTLGIAVTATDNTNGQWQYLLPNGIWWGIEKSGTLSETHALLLPSDAKIRFCPATNYNGTATITYHAWDQNNGYEAESFVDTSADTYSAFSSAVGGAQITVTAVNDAPDVIKKGGGKALQFTGVASQAMTVPDMHLNSSFTVGCWVQAYSYNTWQRIFDFGNGASKDNQILGFCDNSKNMYMEFYENGTSAGRLITPNAFPLNQWVYVTAVYDSVSQTGYIYWNGVLQISGSIPRQTVSSATRNCSYFGKSNWDPDAYFKGEMYNISVWNEAKSPDQIRSDMNTIPTGNETGLVAAYNLTEGSGTTAADCSSAHNNATLSGINWVDNSAFDYSVSGYENSDIAVGNLKMTDVDADNGIVQFSLAASHGTLTLGSTTGLTFSSGANGQSSLTVKGKMQNINDALATLTYHSNTDYTGADSITVQADDLGCYGDGGAKQSAVKTVNVTVQPIVVPDAPTITSVTSGGSYDKAAVTFTSPLNNGGGNIIGYTVTATPTGGGDVVTASGSSPVSVSGLQPGVTYTFTVAAKNSAGTGAVSSSVAYTTPGIPTAPTVNATVSGNPYSGSWTSENVTLIASDSTAVADTIDHYEYKIGDSGTWVALSNSNMLTLDTNMNDSVYFRAVSSSGLSGAPSSACTVKIDKTAPTGMTVKVHQNSFTNFLNTITFGLFFNNDVDVTLSASDAVSNIDYYEYQLIDTSKGQSYNAGNSWTKSVSSTFSVAAQFKGAVYAYAVDQAGNKSAVTSSNGFVADGQTPTAPVITATVNGNSYNRDWTSGNVKLVASGSLALSGVDHYEYQIGSDGAWTKLPEKSGTIDSTSGNAVPDTLTISSDMNNDIHFRAVSNSEITGSESSIIVKRDSVTPNVSVAVNGTTGQWTGSPIAFTLSNSAGNISPDTYWVKIGSGNWTQISGDTVSLTTDTDAVYQFKTISGSGTESPVSASYTVKLDVDSPTITNVIESSDNWTNGNVTLTVSAYDNGSGVKEYSFDGGHNWQTSNTNTYMANQTISSGTIKVRDNAGNETSYNTDIDIAKIDKTAPVSPTISITSNPVKQISHATSFGLFFNNTVNVSLSSTDNLSGIKNYEYQLVSDGDSLSTNGWTACSGTFSINSQFKGTIYARATDNAGNISAAAQSDKFITDKSMPTAPVIAETVNGNAYDGSSWTSGDIKLAAFGSTALSGIDYYEYSTDNGNSWTKMEDQSMATDSTSGQCMNDLQIISTNRNGAVLVRAISNSGIMGSESSITVKRDAATPNVSVAVNGTTGQWTGSPVTFTLSNSVGNISPDTYWVKIGSGDWTQISGDTVSLTADTDAVYQFKTISGSGIESPVSASYTVKLDVDSPTITNVIASADNWTNGNVMLTVSAYDNGSGVKEYSFDGGHNWQTSNTNIYMSNQVISSGTIKVRDNAGNETSYSTDIDITKIDKTAPVNPTITITSNPVKQISHATSFGLFFNNTVNVSLSSTDNLSGIKNYEYQLVSDGGSLSNSGWTACSGGTFSINSQFKGTIYARATDNAGNISAAAQSDKFITDKSTPTAPIIAETVNGNAYDGSTWTSGDIKLAASGSAALSGIDYYEYSTDNGNSWTKMEDQSMATDSTSDQCMNDLQIISTNRNGVVLVRAISNSGIKGETASVPVKRDAAVPGFTVNVTGTVGQWTGNPVTFTMTCTGSNLSPVTYYIKIGTADWVPITGSAFTFSNSMNETCQFKEVSAAGNEATSGIYAVMIDASAPTVSVSGNPTDWTNHDVTLSVDAECSPYGVQSLTVSKDGGSALNITGQNTYRATENGIYVFTATNRAGASVSKTVNVTKIDKTAPTGMTVQVHTNCFTGFLHAISFGLFYQNTVDITLSANDSLSSINYYEYQLIDTSKGQGYNANGTWVKSYSGTFSIDPQFKGVIYARAIDKAGNVTAASEVVQTDGFAVDNQRPTAPNVTATVNGDAYSSGWTSGNVKIAASGSSALSGIQYYEYKIGDNGTWVKMPNTSGTADSTSGTAISDTLTIASDMNGDVYVRAVSNSGIEGNDFVVTVKRDTATPSIQIAVSGTTGQWTENPVAFTFSNMGNSISPITYWVKIGSGDWTQISGSVYQITGNVNTTYQFKAVSNSGVTSSISDTFTVKHSGDTLKAVISNIDSLPDPSVASDQQISNFEQKIKDAKILYDTLSKDQQSAIGQSRINKLNQLINRLKFILVVIPEDTDTGITASNIGTSVKVPELNNSNVGKVVVRLMVNSITSSETQKGNIAIASSSLDSLGKSLVATYDVALFETVFDTSGTQMSFGKVNNSAIDGPVTIQIPVPPQYIGQTGLQVVYINDAGIVTPMPTTLITVDGIEYLQFTTTHFSLYAITVSNKSAAIPNPNTNGANNDLLWYILPLGASGLTVTERLIFHRKKTDSDSQT